MGCTPSSPASTEPDGHYTSNLNRNSSDGIAGQFRATAGSIPEDGAKKPITLLTTSPPRSESNCIDPGDPSWNTMLEKKENQFLRFGPMCLNPPKVSTLLVFAKEDAQAGCIKLAADKLRFQCSVANTPEKALEVYQATKASLVIIDTRQSDKLDPLQVCRSIRGIKGSQYTCIVAVVKKGLAEKEEASVLPLIKSGFNRWFLESCNLGYCLNELIQLEHNEISNLYKLRAAQALFSALDCCREGVLVTSPNHDIQFVNQASERILGHSAAELVGKNAQELQRTDSQKKENQKKDKQIETINKQYRKSKEWETSMLNRKKSAEYLHFWNKIATIEGHKGCIDHLVYVKDMPHFLEKSFSTDPDCLSYSALKAMRKTSCDVRSLCSENNMANASNRRQSFAKFHALTIEAPITKVINLLVSIQDNCQISVAQQLDKVLDILRSTELYSPQFPSLNQNHMSDQVTSDLVTGLMSGNKSALRKMSHEVTGKGPILPQTPTASLPSLATAPLNIKLLLETEMDWGFEIFELEKMTNKRPLIWLGMAIFSRFDVCTSLNCDEATLQNWFSVIESNYHDNPYHNSTHAADVMQATAYFLEKLRLKNIFDSVDEAICLVAAVIHDIDHPGKNSAFLCNSGNPLAILYNDLSVLESHHAAKAFQLTMANDKANILKNLDKQMYREVRQSIIDMVLATEMTKHFEHINKFINSFEKTTPMENEVAECDSNDEGLSIEGGVTPEIVVLVKRMLIKCADVSNPVRPPKLCSEWAVRIAEEYCAQTDEERKAGLPVVMPAFDRKTCNIPKSQLGFIEYFVNDMFDAWDAFGNFPELLEQLKLNYIYWREREQQKDKSNRLEQVAQGGSESS